MPLHTKAFTQRRFAIHTHMPLHTGRFSQNHRRFYTEKPLHRETFTHRSFYTEKPLHRATSTFYTQKLMHTNAFTQRSFSTPSHKKVFIHKRFYTRGLYAQKLFPQRNHFHRAAFTLEIANLPKFLTFGHHFARKGCIWRWRIAIFDVGPSFCVKGFCLMFKNRNFTQVFDARPSFRAQRLCPMFPSG